MSCLAIGDRELCEQFNFTTTVETSDEEEDMAEDFVAQNTSSRG